MKKNIEMNKKEVEELIQETKDNIEALKKFGKDSNYIKELSNLALLQIEIENYIEAKKNMMVCLNHFKIQRDRLGQAAVFGVLGVIYFNKKKYEKSIEYYNKALKIYKDLNQVKEEITCLKSIGSNYIKLNKSEEASDIFLDCSALCSDNDDIYNLLDCLGNLIYIYEKEENWDVLKELYQKSLESFKQLKDSKGIIVTSFNLGTLQKKEKKFNEALNYFNKGLALAYESNYPELIIKGLSYIGEIFFLLGQIGKTKDQFIKALLLAKEVKAKNAIIQLKILLKSLGLKDKDIEEELKGSNKI